MRVLFWYCDHFAWKPTLKTLPDAAPADPGDHTCAVVAFVHVEPHDVLEGSTAETKLVKNAKWLARKWEVRNVVLHSFSHLGDNKAAPKVALDLLQRTRNRLETAQYLCRLTPYGYFNDISITAPGHPLARVYKEF
jgi:hypothetical protein